MEMEVKIRCLSTQTKNVLLLIQIRSNTFFYGFKNNKRGYHQGKWQGCGTAYCQPPAYAGRDQEKARRAGRGPSKGAEWTQADLKEYKSVKATERKTVRIPSGLNARTEANS